MAQAGCCACGTKNQASQAPVAQPTQAHIATKDGSNAVVDVVYKLIDSAYIYPITPSTIMAERSESLSAMGTPNLFGRVPFVRQMQSEKGAAAAMHGALVNCSLTCGFTASQGLLLMIPNLYHLAGECLPGVLHLTTRTVGYQTAGLFPDHTDLYAARQTNCVMLGSASVQEAQDMAAVAHCAAIKLLAPFIHFMDGWRTSHEVQKIETLDDAVLKELFPWDEYHDWVVRASPSNDEPRYRNPIVHYDVQWQAAEANAGRFQRAPGVVDELFDRVHALTGRRYHPFEYYGPADAEDIIVLMGSASKTAEEVVDYLNAKGRTPKAGVLRCRLFRPFSAEHLARVFPASVRRVAVLDRAHEIAAGDPLYLDVVAALHQTGLLTGRLVIGGRYGLCGLDVIPAHLVAVFNHLATDKPRSGFCVGITDDMNHTSLPVPVEPRSTVPEGTTEAQFWGLGADGTVGACREACTIIGEGSPFFPQVFFDYDAKKSGGLTVSHMRFSPKYIKSSYLVQLADFIGCHSQAYLTRYAAVMLGALREGGTLLVNARFSPGEEQKAAEAVFPPAVKHAIAERRAKVFLVNAYRVAAEHHLGRHINFVLLTCFFKLTPVLPFERAVALLQDSVAKLYKKQGPEVIKNNCDAIAAAAEALAPVNVPAEWTKCAAEQPAICSTEFENAEFFRKTLMPSYVHEGADAAPPVSAYADVSDGRWPFGFTKIEKRQCAEQVPWWDPSGCIQCNFCASVCPHATIRPCIVDASEQKPAGFTTVPLKGIKTEKPQEFRIQVSPLDCMGCATCVDVCPKHVLHMKDVDEMVAGERENWDFAVAQQAHTEEVGKASPAGALRTSQFREPQLEFSAACAGCQETPVVKLLVQLFGEHMFLSLAVGCCIVWGGYLTNIGFTPRHDGRGLTIASSLFEDIAEFSLGFASTTFKRRDELRQVLTKVAAEVPALKEPIAKWAAAQDADYATSAAAATELRPMLLTSPEVTKRFPLVAENAALLAKKTMWVVGGDGWAYDMDYDGLDHVLASGMRIHVLVLDNENYGNTGGQFSSATSRGAATKNQAAGKRLRKKDLGSLMMVYRNIYVAYTCIAANPSQCQTALQEADAYPGASVVIAYCPCTNHGWTGTLSSPHQHSKYAVESGMVNLFRFNPLRAAEGKNPLTIDSRVPDPSLVDKVIDGENRFASLKRQRPEEFAHYREELIADIKLQREMLEKLQATMEPPKPAAQSQPATQ
eukprot:TRINITY_DN10539_c0_g5_i1.p1 TRINITY_DN10539_c0_g5~~TRINITY_DN10539_c0_g5_i1.p1  ORF type:complete len:1239 (+),score=370.07 TRINITY_DN10539_c0_g5_i1:36-3719(+)